MSSKDYDKLGLKVGLEIHQQLDTGKLFCRCPSVLRKDAPDFVVRRKLHAVAGEEGEVDVAAMYEAERERVFEYECYYDNTCLVELDEEPPRMINEEALREALKIALLLNCKIYPIVQVMRKTVVDGSNTSGFQRTLLIAHSGWVETPHGKVEIESLALEEDAARVVKREKEKVVYRLDRLGIPLVEISTAPSITKPEQVKDVALKIGEVLRACKVRRGIGTIRQDLNVNIKGHERVEIKGFQEPKMMAKTVELEVERQLAELKDGKKEGEVRAALPDGKTRYLRPLPGRARMYPETDLPLLRIQKKMIDELKRELPKLKSEIVGELKKKGLSGELIKVVLPHLEEFEYLAKVSKNNVLIAKMVGVWRKELEAKSEKAKGEVGERLNADVLARILEKVEQGKVLESEVKQVMEKVLEGEDVEKACEVKRVSQDELREEVLRLVKEKPGLRENAYMGLLMGKFKGKINPREAAQVVKDILSSEKANESA